MDDKKRQNLKDEFWGATDPSISGYWKAINFLLDLLPDELLLEATTRWCCDAEMDNETKRLAELVEVCRGVLFELENMTTDNFMLGDDRPIRKKLAAAIAKATETT